MVLFLLFCGVHIRVNQKKKSFTVLFPWNIRSNRLLYKGTAPSSHEILVATKRGALEHEQIVTLCWYVSYYSETALAFEPWLRKLLGGCQGEGRAMPSFHQTSSSMTLTSTSIKCCERTRVQRWNSLSWHSACLTMASKPRSRTGFKDRTSPSTTMTGINHRRLW